jgi:hypothetical protein
MENEGPTQKKEKPKLKKLDPADIVRDVRVADLPSTRDL